MRIPGLRTARTAVRWLRSRFVDGALILGYHRVGDVADDPYRLCVTPAHFAEHLDVLRRQAHPISLAALMKGLQAGHLPPRALVLTFDDGYLDALTDLKPLLEQYDVPATVFVTSGHFGKEFWWDTLQRLIYAPAVLPDHLSLEMNGKRVTWTADAKAPGPADREGRRQVLFTLYAPLLHVAASEREEVLERLREWAGVSSDHAPAARAVTETELVRLASSDRIDIGAHTVTHPKLTAFSAEVQRREIEQGKHDLETVLGRPVPFFSYPHGFWSAATEHLVREAGFAGACGGYKDVARRIGNRYHLPRLWPANRDGEAFSRWLHRWVTR